MPGAIMQPEKVRNHSRLRLPLIAGLVLLLAVSCDSSHAASLDHAANLGQNVRVAVNPAAGRGNPNQEGGHRRESGFFVPVKRHTCAFSMAGRGGEPSGCRSLLAGFPHPAMRLPPQPWKVGGGFDPKKEATMPKLARALSRIFTAAHPVAHFPTESEAVLFARQYLAQTGRAVAVAPAVMGFDVIGGGV